MLIIWYHVRSNSIGDFRWAGSWRCNRWRSEISSIHPTSPGKMTTMKHVGRFWGMACFYFQRVIAWVQLHRKKRNRQVPDAFLERFGSTSHEKSRTVSGWRAFLCHRRCQGDFVVDTTKSSHYRVFYSIRPFSAFFIINALKQTSQFRMYQYEMRTDISVCVHYMHLGNRYFIQSRINI